MKPGYATKSNLGVGGGILITTLFLYLLIAHTTFALSLTGKAIAVFGSIAFIWGCCMYASGKGYHPAWGVLGLANFPGLFILALFPDRFPQPRGKRYWLIVLGSVLLILFIPVMGVLLFLNSAIRRAKIEPITITPAAQESIVNGTPVSDNKIRTVVSDKNVHVFFLKTGVPEQIAGFVYVDTDGIQGAERAIRIMYSKTWSLAEASRPGMYDRQIAQGKISDDGVLQGLPVQAFSDAKKVWKNGPVDVVVDGQPLTTLTH